MAHPVGNRRICLVRSAQPAPINGHCRPFQDCASPPPPPAAAPSVHLQSGVAPSVASDTRAQYLCTRQTPPSAAFPGLWCRSARAARHHRRRSAR